MPTYTLNNVNYTYTVGTVDASVGASGSATGNISLLSSFVVGGATYNVTSIAASAFFNNRTVTHITVPDSVTSIGNAAFSFCTELIVINIPNSVTSIGANAFEYCDKITSLTLPNALTTIGASAFFQCYGLTSIEFPASLTSIGANNFTTTFVRSYVFKNSTLAATVGTIITQIVGLSITFDYVGSIPASMMASNVTLTNLTLGPNITAIGASAFSGCTALSSVIIPNSVTSIGASAFNGCVELLSFTIPDTITVLNEGILGQCKKLSSVTIPASVTTIGTSVFSGCTSLSSVTILGSVTSIGINAFYNCSRLSSFSVPASIVTIGTNAFYGCTNLVNIVVNSLVGTSIFSTMTSSTNLSVTFNYAGVIPDSITTKIRNLTSVTFGPNITKIGISSFDTCIFLSTVNIPDSVTIIDNSAFFQCYRLKTVTISNSSLLTKIGNTAFSSCSQLTSINIPSTITTIGVSAFYYCIAMVSCTTSQSGTLLLSIPNSVFNYCSSLQSFTIPPSVTSLGGSVFYNCSSLSSVTIPPSVTSIGGSVFYNCSSLTGVTLPNLTIINPSIFFGCSNLINVNIPSTVTTIESNAFSDCASLTSLTIPQSVSIIRVDSFKKCTGLITITVASNNATYSSVDGVLFNKAKTTLMVYPPKSPSTSYVIPSTVVIVAANAFCNCANLTSLTIPNSTTNIQSLSFFGFPSLSTIVINSTHTGFLYENGVLFNKAKTNLMLYPGGLANTSYAVPSTVTTIFSAAFYGAKNLTSVTIPTSVTVINDSVFYGCSGLTSIIIPSAATYIDTNAFYGCSSLTSVTFPATVNTIYTSAFNGCSSLSSFTFPPLVTRLEANVLTGCSSLTSVTIPSTLTTIVGGNPFHNCTNLTSITVDANNAYFSSDSNGILFSKTKSTLILYPRKLLNTSYVIPSTVTLINLYAFNNCANLRTVMIPAVTTLFDSTFNNCSNLMNVIFTGLVPRIDGTNFGAIGDTAVYDSVKNPNNVLNQLSMFTNTINQPTPTLTNFTLPGFTFTTVPYTMTPPTSDVSGGVMTYVSTNTSIATVSGNILTMVTVANGSSNITATQTFTNVYGDLSFTTFGTITSNTLYISQGYPALVFSIPAKTVGDASFSLVNPTVSNGVFSYTSSSAAVATISSTGRITINGPGVTTITFNQTGTAEYITMSITAQFAVDAATATITPTFGNFTVPAKLPGSAPFILVPPTSDSSGAFTYTSSNSDVGFLSGNQVSIRQPGSCTIIATQAGNATYKSRSVSALFYVSLTQPTILTNFSVETKTFGDASFNITPPTTTGNGLITYTSSNTSVATIVGSVVSIVGAGTSTITASQAATAIYMAATTSSVLTVNQATPTIPNFSVPTKTALDASFSLIAPTSNSTGTFTYTSSNTAVATISGDAVTIVGVGTSTITAVQASSTNYVSGSTTTSFEVTQGVLVLTNFSVPTKSLGNADFTLVPPTTVSPGLITYTSSDISVATIVGSTVTIVGVGSCTITADQESTVNYTSATITATLTVLPAPTMTDFSVPVKSVLDGSFNLVAPTSDSDGLITYTSSDTSVATIVGSRVTIVGGGSATITAVQAFTAVYGPGSISATLVVNKLTTTISAFTIAPKAVLSGRFTIGAGPLSNRADFITLTSSNPSVAIIERQALQGIWNITPLAVGNTTIIATQPSTSMYETGTSSTNFMVYPVGSYTHGNVNYGYNIGLGTADVLGGTAAGTLLSSLTVLESFVIDGTTYTVTGISRYAFDGWGALTSISLPPSILTMGFYCFANSNLTTFTFPPLVTVLEESVFRGSGLTSITIPPTLTTFKYLFNGNHGGSSTGAFSGCTKLVNIVINVYIPGFQYVFWKVNNANMSVTFDYPGTLPPNCLENMNNLKTVIIGNQTTSTGNSAFTCCSSLTNVTLGSSLTTIGHAAFYLCTSLKNITLPSSLISIGNGSFNGCTSLNNIILPSSLTTIMYGAFANCTSFTSITLPSSLTSLESGLFTNCTNLTNVVVKKYLGALAYTFNSINSLNMSVTFDYSGLIPANVCSNVTNLKTVNISNTITGVEVHAFAGCTGLTEIIFPDSVTVLHSNAFLNCTNLNSVSFLGNIPGIGSNNFASLTDTAFYKVDGTANINTNPTTVTASLSMFTTKTVVTYASPTITNLLTPMKKYNDISFSIVDPSSNSSGAFTYTSSNTAVATVSGNVVTIGTSGSTTITATQVANYRNGVDYTSGTITSTFVVDNPPPQLGPLLVTNKSLSDVSFTIVEPVKPANSSGTWTYTSSDVTKATISGNEVTLLDVGIVIISATVSSDSNYCSTTVTGRLSISAVDVTPSTFVFISTSDVSNAIPGTVQPISNTVVVPSTIFTPTSLELFNPSTGTLAEKLENRNSIVNSLFDLYYNVNTITIPPSAIYLPPAIDLSNITAVKVFKTTGSTDQSPLVIDASSLNLTTAFFCQFDEVGNSALFNGTNTFAAYKVKVTKVSATNYTVTQTKQGVPTTFSATANDVIYYAGFKLVLGSITGQLSTLQLLTLSNFALPDKVLDSVPFTITPPTTVSDGLFTYTSSDTSVATIVGNVVTVVGLGTSTITAVQARTATYLSDTITATLTVNKIPTVLSNFVVPTKTFGNEPFTITPPTTNSDGTFTYTSSNTAVATIDGSTVTILAVGSCTITAVNETSARYISATITANFIVNKITPTITNFVVPAKVFGDVSFNVVPPTTDSDGTFTYTSSNTAVATISGSRINIVGGGSATITATQATTTNYLAGSITASLVVSQATTVLSNFSVPAKTFGNAAFALTAPTTNGNGAFTYTSSNTAVATIAGSTLTIVGAGTATITANQASTANYLAATTTATITVSQATPILSSFVVPTKVIGNAAFTIPAPTTNSNGLITYTSSNPAVATIAGSTITIVGVGTCTITADQASTTNYLAGTITANFVVNQITTVLSGFSVTAKQFAGADFNLVAPTTNSPGTLTYTSSNAAVATIVGTTVTIVGVGSSTISAVQASTTNYTSATVTSTLTVSKATTVLTNFSVATKTFGDASFSIVAPTTNSNGVITYASSNTAVATVSGSTITIVGAGSSTITATQSTNTNYLAATTTASLTVNKATTVLTNFSVPLKIIGNAPFSIVAPTTNSNGAFTYTSSDTTVATIAGTVITILGIGTSTITASQATTSNFTAATTTAVFQVNNKTPIITNFVIPTKTFGDLTFSLADPSSNSIGAFNYRSSNTAVATIEGNIVTIIGAGASTITATQAVTADYIDGTITATLTVNPTSTTVVYNALSNIVYTTPLVSCFTATNSANMAGLIKYYINSSQVYSTTVLTTGTYTVSATFTPTSSNYSSSTATQSLTVDKKSTTIGFPSTSTIEYETTLADFITKTSTGVAGTFAFYYLSGGSTRVNLSSATVLAVGQYEINADFTPTDSVNYLPSSGSTVMTVSPKTVTVLLSGLPAINYGQTLSSSLAATLSQPVDGSFNYYLDVEKTTEATVATTLNVGSYTLYAVFTPASSNYVSEAVNTSVVVNKLTPTLTFPIIPSITYGTRLATFIADTTASVAGTFHFYLADGTALTSSTMLAIGNYVIFCTFTPTNSTNYLVVNDAKVLSVSEGEEDLFATDSFDITKVMDEMSLWIDAKSSTKFDYDQGKQSWSDRVAKAATHVAAGIGVDSTLAYSYDGINWIRGGILFQYQAYCVATNGSIWLVGGNSGSLWYGSGPTASHSAAYSFDGINWTGINGPALSAGNIKGFAYGKDGSNNNMWVAVGEGLSTSFDGVNWIGRSFGLSSYCNAVAFNGSRWICVGSNPNTMTTSTNGINWTGLGSTIFSHAGYGIACNESMWVAVGQGTNSIAYSYDGTTWKGVISPPLVGVGYGVAWNGSMWVAVGAGGNSIAYSYDGIAWTGVTGSAMFSLKGWSIAWNGSEWLAGGEGTNTLASSTDGITWRARSNTLSTAVCGVCGYKTTNEVITSTTLSKYLLTGAGTNSLGLLQNSTSFGGLNRRITFTTQGNAIFYNSNKWVAVGQGGNTIATSNNGLVWTGIGATTFTTTGNDVINDGAKWIAVGQGGNTVATSSDNGATWSGQTLSYFTSGTSILYAVPVTPTATTTRYDASLASSTVTVATPSYIATGIGATASIAVSTDAVTWTPIGVISGGYGIRVFTTQANCVYGTAGSYVAVGQGGNSIARSNDGINWTGSGSTVFTTAGYGVYTNGSIWVAVGEGGNTIATSTDRITWTGLGATIFTGCGNKVVWNAELNLWIATGQGGNTVATSTNGTTWVGRGATMFTSAGRGIARTGPAGSTALVRGSVVQKTTDNKLFFFVSVGRGGNTISFSPDGKQWHGTGATVFTSRGNRIAHNGTMYVLAGEGGNTIAYSNEGVYFIGLGATVFTLAGYGIANNSYMWVAVGKGGNTIATSTNGTTWVGRSSAFSTAGYNVTWANNQWVAVGEGGNTISSSIDGITWTGREASIIFTKARGIAYGANRWVAVGEGANTIATSPDGITWTGLGSTTFTTVGNNVAWNGSRFVAVGQGGNTVATSVDGTTWSAVAGTTFSNYGSDIKWLHNNWVAAGSDPSRNYLGSVDGLIWTSLGRGTYTTEALGVGGYAYVNKTRYVTVGGGSYTQVCTSYDGINWIHTTSIASYGGACVAFGKDASDNDLWVACSGGIVTSLDGFNSHVNRYNGGAVCAAYGGNTWVAASGNSSVFVSSNGFITTTVVTTSPIGTTKAVAFNGSQWVLGGSGGNIFATSANNGVTWVGRGSTTAFSQCNCIVWGNGLWVAGVNGLTGNGIATSTDGITWTGRAAGVTDNAQCIGWNGSIFVAGCYGGASKIVTSPDGIVWTARNAVTIIANPPSTVVWDGSKWIMLASGNPSAAYSFDGINWMSKTPSILVNGLGTSLGKLQSSNDTYPVVVKVYDKSSKGNNSTVVWENIQSNFTTSRVLRENLINGYPALQLVRSGFTNPYTPGYSGNTFSFFAVVKFNMMFGSPRFISFGPGSTADDASLSTAFTLSGVQTSATNYALSLWRNNVQFPISSIVLGTPYLISAYFTGSKVHVGINGVYTAFDCSGNFNIQKVGVGINTFDNSGSTHATDYGEIMTFTTVPTSIQRLTLEGYLAHKWGLLSALSDSHPYKTIEQRLSPIFIPQSNNSGYARRIVETFPMSYYPVLEEGSKLGNYSSLEKYRDGTFSGQPSYDANIIQDMSLYYNFNVVSAPGSNYATGAYVVDASLSASGLVSTTTFKFGTSSLVLSPTSSLTLPPVSVYPLGTSFSFWLKSNANASNSYVFALRNNSDLNQQSIYFNISGNTYSLNVINSSASSSTLTGTANINNNAWVHFVWTMDPNGNWQTYINNVLTDNSSGRVYPTICSRNTCNLGAATFTDAHLDEFMMFNRVLTAAEVSTLFEGTPIYLGTNPVITSTSDQQFGTMSLRFPGTGHTGTVALNPLSFSEGNAMTLSAWVKFASLDSVPRTIVSLTNATDSIRLAATSANYVLYRGNSALTVPVTPTLNTWTHLVANCPNIATSTNSWQLSVNKNATTTSVEVYPSTTPGNNVYTKCAIGMDVSSNSAKMDGFIDDVRVFNSSLSTAQVSQLYDGRVDLNAIASHYTFDSVKGNTSLPNFASGSVVYDASITNMDLHTTVGNRLGLGCLNFYSTNYAGTVTLGPIDLRADPNNATFSTWVKFSSLDTVPRTVFSFGQNNRSITLSATYNNYTFTYRNASSTSFINVPGTHLDTWNHIAVEVNNAASNSWLFYLNGLKTRFLVDSSSALALPAVDFANVYTSNYLGVDVSVNKMHGYVDDTRIYNKGLTDSEVLNVLNTDAVFSVETIKLEKQRALLTTITLSSISSFAYGATMSAFINGTTVSAEGTLKFYASYTSLQEITVSTVLDAGTYTIYCSFTPTDPAEFQSTSATKTITVQKLTSTVTLPSISTFAYGTTMSSFISQTTTSVVGLKSFYVTDPSGQELTASSILNVGTYTIYCNFDPTNSANYTSSFATKQLIVTQLQINMVYGPLYALTYGTTLLSRLSASITPVVDGSMSYYINSVQVSSTTILDASSHVITATFVPTSSNYLGSSTSLPLVVNKSPTIVTYPALQSVFFNSAIGTDSLRATVTPDVSGNMAYFTNSTFTNQVMTTTLLPQGTYTLYARFTPTSPNYMVSSATSSLTVLGQTAPTITFPTVTNVDAYSTLESVINGISAGVAGTFLFNKNSITGAILTAASTFDVLGSFAIFCRFSPTDAVRYLPATATFTVNVKHAPVFYFNQRPSSVVTYGTNLSGSVLATTVNQFNNTTIPGTVTFSNGLTTNSFLTPGIYTVVATFTPTNTSIYSVVSASKQILVSKQPLTVNITSPSVKSAFIGSAPIDCSYQVWGLLTALGDTFANSVSGTIGNKYYSFDGTTSLTSSYVYNTTFAGSSQTYKIASDISGFFSTKYDFTPQTYTFTVNKYTPTINYMISLPNKTIMYGTPLGNSQLIAVVSYNGVPVTSGSVVYTRSVINMDLSVNLQTILDVGQYNLYAYYSDLSSNIYNSVNTSAVATNQITVAKATPVVLFPNIKSILVGTNLNNILEFTVATLSSEIIPGTIVFSYVNQSGATVIVTSSTVLTRPPSSYTINAAFTPTNSARYNTSAGSITIGLSDLNSSLTANRLIQQPFTYGKSFNQLYNVNVSPSIAGTYAYYNDVYTFNPASILDAGHHNYTVIFNPTSSSYVSSVIDVSFTVEKASMTISYAKPPSYAFQTSNQLSLLQPVKSIALDGTLKIYLDSSFTTELTNATPMAIGTYTLYVRFTPLKNYNVATVTTTLTVTQIQSKLTYTTKSSTIAYGASISQFLTNAIVDAVPGVLQYYYDVSYTQIVNSTNLLPVGTHTIYGRFVPSNSTNAVAYSTNTIKVNRAVLSIAYPKLATINYGTTLQSSLIATSTFDGSMNYFINGTQVFANTLLNAGTHNIVATFIPKTPNNFTTSSVSVTRTLTIAKQTTVITYMPNNIPQGTPFGPSMTATVSPSIPGIMRYFRNNTEILSSTVLNSGNYNIVITFTPSNITNYKTATITSAITVITTQQLAIINENTSQIQNAVNNQTVSIVTQNPLLPASMNVKVNKMTANQTSITATTTNTAVTGLKFDFGNGAVGTNVTVAVSALTVNLPNAANTPAIFFKFYDENGNSIVSKSNPVTLTLKLPKYKGKTKNLFLARLQDVGTLVDGSKIPLTSVNPKNPQNIDFTAVFTSNSVYAATEEESTESVTSALDSNMYAFEATGGFVMQRGFDDVKVRDMSGVETFDVTDSVQILFDVALFNSKLGLNKSSDNNAILSTRFNPVTDQFELDGSPINTLSFTASEFIEGVIKKQQIISVGKYSTVYSDFRNYVATYFGFDGGFSSLFTAASEFAIDVDNHFDSESMMQLFASVTSTESEDAHINQMTGAIYVSNITKSLRYCIDTNCFGNRTPIVDPSQNASGSAVDPDDKNNYGVADGFVAGDLLWIPTGTQLNLNLNIDVESFMPLNNVGPQNISSSQTTNYSSGNFSRETTATLTNINRTVRAPLLIKLVNGSTINAL